MKTFVLQPQTITFEHFVRLAINSQNGKQFLKSARKIKNVPDYVANLFHKNYGHLDMDKAADQFVADVFFGEWNKYLTKGTHKKVLNIRIGSRMEKMVDFLLRNDQDGLYDYMEETPIISGIRILERLALKLNINPDAYQQRAFGEFVNVLFDLPKDNLVVMKYSAIDSTKNEVVLAYLNNLKENAIVFGANKDDIKKMIQNPDKTHTWSTDFYNKVEAAFDAVIDSVYDGGFLCLSLIHISEPTRPY